MYFLCVFFLVYFILPLVYFRSVFFLLNFDHLSHFLNKSTSRQAVIAEISVQKLVKWDKAHSSHLATEIWGSIVVVSPGLPIPPPPPPPQLYFPSSVVPEGPPPLSLDPRMDFYPGIRYLGREFDLLVSPSSPSLGIVKMGICVMEPFLPSTRPARS